LDVVAFFTCRSPSVLSCITLVIHWMTKAERTCEAAHAAASSSLFSHINLDQALSMHHGVGVFVNLTIVARQLLLVEESSYRHS
jgi:hypothetical protein